MAETVIGLFKTEEIHRAGPWRGLEDVEFATLEWVSWFNTHRLLEPRIDDAAVEGHPCNITSAVFEVLLEPE